MPRSILIHAGLHKTATTNLQKTLADNAALFEPHFEVHARRETDLLGEAALNLAEARNKVSKAALFETATQYFATLDPDDPRPVVFSNESFAGHFIGHPRIFRYGATHVILEQLHNAWCGVMGVDAGFDVYISTRRTGWIEACYWEKVKRTRLKLDLDDFRAKFPDADDHDAVLARVKERIGAVRVHSAVMEDMPHPIVPLLKLLDAEGLFASLTLPRDQNMRLPRAVYDELLDLNRSDLDWSALHRAKKALLLAKDPDWEGLL